MSRRAWRGREKARLAVNLELKQFRWTENVCGGGVSGQVVKAKVMDWR